MHTDLGFRKARSQYVDKHQNRRIGMFSLIGFSNDIAERRETKRNEEKLKKPKKNKAVFI